MSEKKVKLPRKNVSRPSRETLPGEILKDNSVPFGSVAASAAGTSKSPPKDTDGDEECDPNFVYQKVKLPRKNVSRPSRETLPGEILKDNSVPFGSVAASAAKTTKSPPKVTDGDEECDPSFVYQKVKLPRADKNKQSRRTPPAPADKPNVVPANRSVPSSSIAAPAVPILPSSTPAAEALDAPASSHVDAANAALETSAPATSFSQETQATGGQGGGAGQAEVVTPSSRRFKKRMSQSPAGVEHLSSTTKKRKLSRSFRESLGGSVSRMAAINRFLEDNAGVDAASPIEEDAAWFQKRRMTLTPAVRRPSLGAAVRSGVTPGRAGRGGWSVQRCALMQEAGQAGKESRQAGSEAGEAGSKQTGREGAVQVGKAGSKQDGEASVKQAGDAGQDGSKVLAGDKEEQVIREGTTAEQVQASGEASKQGADLGMGVEGPVELTKEYLESRMNIIFAQETCNADQKPVRIARQVKACLKRCYLASMLDIRAFEPSTDEGSEDEEEEEENAGKGDGGASGKSAEPATGEQAAGGGRNESLASVRFRIQAIEEILPVVEEKIECTRSWISTTLSLCEQAATVEQQLIQAYPGAAAAAVGGSGDSRGSTAAVRGAGGLAGVPLAVLTPRTAARGLANLGHPDMPTDLEW
ncbi:unnamed protein product [Closterium sp. Yama58-4]|nr:unnamed protein product [Closterium sp. Yama58-4]